MSANRVVGMVVLSGGPASGGDFKSNSGAGGGFNFVFFEGLLKFCHAVNVSLSIHFLHSVEPSITSIFGMSYNIEHTASAVEVTSFNKIDGNKSQYCVVFVLPCKE